ncbi:MAG TPA: DNA polymerase I [Cellvibrionaceae bacterium]
MSEQAPLILVDGSSYLYRAFHAAPPLTNAAGEPTGAVKLVLNMVRRLLKDYPKSPIAMIFDAKGKTFRDDLFEHYKAHRPPMPDDLRVQVEPIHQAITAMGLPLIVIDGVEADDVIGTLCRQATELQQPVIISTGDKDMAQLVNPWVSLHNTMTETRMDQAGVLERFGLPPHLIIDYLALMGDKVDNIPGVPGVGEKTAQALLTQLGNLNAIYERMDEVAALPIRGAKSLAEKLREHETMARLSYQLATIKIDCELPFACSDLQPKPADVATLKALYERLEFKSWVNELNNIARASDDATVTTNTPVVNTPELTIDYQCIFTLDELNVWIKRLEQTDYFAFDTETTSLNYMEAKLVGVSFACTPGQGAYVPFGHDYLGAPTQLTQEQVLTALKPLLENPQHKKLGQHIKYDAHVLANVGVNMQGITYDTMLEGFVVNSTTRQDMDSLAELYLQQQTIHFADIAGKGAKALTFNQIAVEKAAPYAAEDADITLRLHQVLFPQIQADTGLLNVYSQIEMPLLPVLMRIERTGALIDSKILQQQSMQLAVQLDQLQKEAFELAGEEFNLSSPKQLGEILFNKLKIPAIKKTATGQASTAEDVLQELALDYPLPKLLLEHRSLAKLKSTYTDKLPHMVNPNTGRVHTSYHQAGAATGRFSSTEPNLQNIPIKTAEGRRIRQAFIAPPGFKIVAADYSQIELRIMAHLSQDAGLLTAFSSGQDVHRATAAEVFGVPLTQVSHDQRRSAKAINFGLIYGMSAFGLAKQLRIGRGEAQKYIDLYFARYPGVKRYMDETRAIAYEQGYVSTLCGRRLYLPDIRSTDRARRQGAERTAINAPMQGTAADVIKMAMVTVDNFLQQEKLNARIIMQVHDELVFEIEESLIAELTPKICALMSGVLALDVPLLVEAGVGNNWDEAH